MRQHVIMENITQFKPASTIFVINDPKVNEHGVVRLIDLMGSHNFPFYQSSVAGMNKGSHGLIARDDTLILKINSQWNERGGTNTDLLKSLIKAIVNHPDGFSGEIIVADNGQAQFGSAGTGGRLDWERNNAEDISQSVQKVVDSFSDYRVSSYLWDNITTHRVKEYGEKDMNDGYVINGAVSSQTGLMVSYPKFQTRWGTPISFKLGIWDAKTKKYDNNRLKFINIPVLKAHFIYGVTGCLKHYMGVVSDKLTAQLGARSHNTVGTGGMGSEMVGTRFPIINIIDAIWVNAKPGGGPKTGYDSAIRSDVIAASTDPVALDYWVAKNILMRIAREAGFNGLSSIDPDNIADGSFGQWLRLAMEEIKRAGYPTTIAESHMNIHVAEV